MIIWYRICSQKHSSNHHIKWLELFGGDGGIRTHVALITPKRFRVLRGIVQTLKIQAVSGRFVREFSPVFCEFYGWKMLEKPWVQDSIGFRGFWPKKDGFLRKMRERKQDNKAGFSWFWQHFLMGKPELFDEKARKTKTGKVLWIL